ncbi:hypothetical protein FHW36_11825 [Chitinophaga polysaccharea]|uniref:Uncharacterized protein n=1 Tax=Chitinophaga polysaccharea TaxID=1293035 RepID=A0A561P0S2_9BACT|nr:hypothetical protein FHW36_11825 [Chitinophaga polysaccharea]
MATIDSVLSMTSTSFLISVNGRDYIVLPHESGDRMIYRVQIDRNVIVFVPNESGSLTPVGQTSKILLNSIAQEIERYFL